MNDHNRLVEQTGVYHLGCLAARLGYLFRQIKEHDKGVDAEIELTQSIGVASPIIGVQIKARSDFRKNADNTISITVTEQNLRYWKSFGRPVVLMAYSDKETDVYWTRVDNASSRTIRISLDQKFDESTMHQFARIISQYHANVAWNMPTKNASEILAELGSTVGEVLTPIEQKVRAVDTLMTKGRYKDAAPTCEALATIYEDAPSIWYNWVVCLLESGERDRALDVANEVLKKLPERWESYHLVGTCLGSLDRYEEAENLLLKALELAPLSPEVWNNLGLLHYWQGRNKEAYEEFYLAAAYEPDDKCSRFNLALCSTALGNYEEALHYYDACININPNFYDALNNKGRLLRYLWRIGEALDSYDSAIEIDSRNPAALCNSAYLLKDLGYNERAIQRYHMALEELPDNDSLHFNLGVLCCRTGNWKSAAYHFDKAYNLLKSDLPRKEFEGLVGIIDIGYEVAYFIRVEFTKHSVRIFSVDPEPKCALFNAVPSMRELLNQAHTINRPLPPEDPRKAFAPNRFSDDEHNDS